MDYSVSGIQSCPQPVLRAQGDRGFPLRAQLSMALPLDCPGRGVLLAQGMPRSRHPVPLLSAVMLRAGFEGITLSF